ncbi:hypothetical protein IMG5_005660 [Ichthyophthirius multifiliis]|uniref:EF-hand domain-containing protein n=1 Tax=Ichthyophthirius multifiliis TaxID=5932 RepID=G0QJI4_ICHMU|nr:hypothetical protein IMG5_005660 [Ichthyophthirius multifiliis]EGR34611.1 hypothetical protein IMG5_005660 [Ichthyophthirius multifiliis]|eukprot:XP_004039915.1 hypothetical protein IMG5_005660 [Ichthyophthirius multifiliis]
MSGSGIKSILKDKWFWIFRKNELEQVMINVASDIGVDKPTKDDVDEVLKELDENGDGKLSMEEFQVLIEQVLEMMSIAENSK